jgi:hypothetical protein
MIILLKLFFNICLFRAAPQDIPTSTFLKTITVITYGLSSMGISLLEMPVGNAVLPALVDTLMLVGLAQASLWIRNFPERKTQTISALAGTGTLVQLMAWPMLNWLFQNDVAQFASPLRWIYLFLVLWNLAIIAHILRHALSLTFPIATGIAVLYVFLSYRVANILFIAAS